MPKQKNKIVLLEDFLRSNKIKFRYNTLLSKYEIKDKIKGFVEIDDDYINTIKITFQKLTGQTIGTDTLLSVIQAKPLNSIMSIKDTKDPICEVIDPVKEGFEMCLQAYNKAPLDYFDQLCESLDCNFIDSEFKKIILKKVFLNFVGTAIDEDGLENPFLLILQGGQNVGKTSLLRQLLPKCLDFTYEGPITSPKDKEMIRRMSSNLMYIDDEMSGKNKNDNKYIKAVLSSKVLSFRLNFGVFDKKLPRRASFFGTTNELEILTDTTGNRRQIILSIKKINFDLYNSIDKMALFGQLYKEYQELTDDTGYRLTGQEVLELNEYSKHFFIKTPLQEVIESNFIPATKGQKDVLYYTSTDIINALNDGLSTFTFGENRIKEVGQILTAYAPRISKKINGVPKYVYVLKKRT
jgi:hypothetical protein